MEQREQPQPSTPQEYFKGLGIGVCAKLPFSSLKPSDIDDHTTSHTNGPIEVYQNDQGELTILNGNHRYHQILGEIKKNPDFKPSDFDNKQVIIKKVEKNIPW